MKQKQEFIGQILVCLLEALAGILLLVNPAGFTSAIIVGAGVFLLVCGLLDVVRYFRMPVDAAIKKQPMVNGRCS